MHKKFLKLLNLPVQTAVEGKCAAGAKKGAKTIVSGVENMENIPQMSSKGSKRLESLEDMIFIY